MGGLERALHASVEDWVVERTGSRFRSSGIFDGALEWSDIRPPKSPACTRLAYERLDPKLTRVLRLGFDMSLWQAADGKKYYRPTHRPREEWRVKYNGMGVPPARLPAGSLVGAFVSHSSSNAQQREYAYLKIGSIISLSEGRGRLPSSQSEKDPVDSLVAAVYDILREHALRADPPMTYDDLICLLPAPYLGTRLHPRISAAVVEIADLSRTRGLPPLPSVLSTACAQRDSWYLQSVYAGDDTAAALRRCQEDAVLARRKERDYPADLDALRSSRRMR